MGFLWSLWVCAFFFFNLVSFICQIEKKNQNPKGPWPSDRPGRREAPGVSACVRSWVPGVSSRGYSSPSLHTVFRKKSVCTAHTEDSESCGPPPPGSSGDWYFYWWDVMRRLGSNSKAECAQVWRSMLTVPASHSLFHEPHEMHFSPLEPRDSHNTWPC